jgi:flagellar hook protein FlgE
MMRGMYSAISGLKTHQIALDVTAHDLANVNTAGFKASRTSFRDSLSQLQRSGAGSSEVFGGANAAQVGLGVQLGSIDNVMSAGALQSTGNTLDVAIQGDGWFRVGLAGSPTAGDPTAGVPASATLQFTRVGNLNRNDQGYLTTPDGQYVIGRTQPSTTAGSTDCYINIPTGATNVAVGQDGSVSFVPPAGYTQPAGLPPIGGDGRAIGGYLSLGRFANEGGLERVTNNRWRASPASGGETAGTPGGGFGVTVGGALEMSNVDMATEFTNMITAQRGFQANSRVISVADEMLQDLTNLKR